MGDARCEEIGPIPIFVTRTTEVRRGLVHRFPYAVYFVVSSDYIAVIAVMCDDARKSGKADGRRAEGTDRAPILSAMGEDRRSYRFVMSYRHRSRSRQICPSVAFIIMESHGTVGRPLWRRSTGPLVEGVMKNLADRA